MKTPQFKKSTRIKLAVYYSHRKDGTPYTQVEIQQSFNLRKHPIYDGDYTTYGKFILRFDKSIEKCLQHIKLHGEKIITAIIIYNNYTKGEELTIGKYTRLNGWNFTPPTFKTDGDGNVTIKDCTVLKRDKMRDADIKNRFIELQTISK
jgi:hypothetical protein